MNATIATRRGFLKAVGLAVASIAAGPLVRRAIAAEDEADAKTTKRPNVLFIYTDDQREDTVSALGNPNIKTPNLDSLVKRGMVFRNAYCMGGFSGAVCLPSRMQTLRGRCWFHVRNLPAGFSNFPASMKQAGYETFFLGKRGNSDQQVQSLFEHSGHVNQCPQPGKPLADGTIEFLKTRKKDRPFFIYLGGPAPHDPRVAPKEYMDMYDPARIPLPANFKPFHPFNNGEMTIRDEKLAHWPRGEDEIRGHLRNYYAMITHLDAQIGRIFQALKDAGDFDNTIVVFSSDQGIAIGSHGLMGKQNLYEPSMGVPLIFAGPGIPAGKQTDAFAYHFDIMPTVLDLVRAPVPTDIDGKSLAGIIHGQSGRVRDTIFLAYKDIQRAVRKGPWKLLRYPKVDKTQLFNLADDPNETKDLAGEPAQAGRVKEMLALMADQQKLWDDKDPLTVANPAKAEVDLDFFRKPASKAQYGEAKPKNKAKRKDKAKG